MWIVKLALRRPYTFVIMALLITILGVISILPTDIFPYIDIPVLSVLFTYSGLAPEEMATRVVTTFERGITTNVNDIEPVVYSILHTKPPIDFDLKIDEEEREDINVNLTA